MVTKNKIGAIIARFQVHKLHEGHIHFIDAVCEYCDEVIVLLGVAPKVNGSNCLPFELRRKMILEKYPKLHVLPLFDREHDNTTWSRDVDALLTQFGSSIPIFHSRDSFKDAYSGNAILIEIPELAGFSGTQLREGIEPIHTEEFRAGIIYALTKLIK